MLIWFPQVRRPAVYTPAELGRQLRVRRVGSTPSAELYVLCPADDEVAAVAYGPEDQACSTSHRRELRRRRALREEDAITNAARQAAELPPKFYDERGDVSPRTHRGHAPDQPQPRPDDLRDATAAHSGVPVVPIQKRRGGAAGEPLPGQLSKRFAIAPRERSEGACPRTEPPTRTRCRTSGESSPESLLPPRTRCARFRCFRLRTAERRTGRRGHVVEGGGYEVVAIEGCRHCRYVARSDHIVGVDEDELLPGRVTHPTLVAYAAPGRSRASTIRRLSRSAKLSPIDRDSSRDPLSTGTTSHSPSKPCAASVSS